MFETGDEPAAVSKGGISAGAKVTEELGTDPGRWVSGDQSESSP